MHVNRRFFLRSTGALIAYCGVAPLPLLAARPQPVRPKRTLVALFLRGGIDGLNLIVPYGENHYYEYRDGIAIPRPGQNNGVRDLNGFFGLHPAAAAVHPYFLDGRATALHAVGYSDASRSHFEEQDTWETGVVGNTTNSDGWLNRHLATSQGHGPIRAVSIGGKLPKILQGKESALAVRGLKDLGVSSGRGDSDEMAMRAALEGAYDPIMHPAMMNDAREQVAQSAQSTFDAMRHLSKAASDSLKPRVAYPDTRLARSFETASRLIRANVGIEVIEITYGGWDTHRNQGGVGGNYANKVKTLMEALDAFSRDLGSQMNETLVLTLSDFGRTAKENGNSGTDHGWANCLLALGGGVVEARRKSGNPVHTDWPGLAPEKLNQKRDLKNTIDFRDVIAEAVQKHLGNPHLKTVLPQHNFKPVGYLG